jgi:hypothetical protein
MSKSARIFSGLLAILLMVALPAFCYEVALKDGRVIRFQKYRASETALIYINDQGKEISIPLSSIDPDRTRELNTQENPPLNLPGLITTLSSPNSDSVPSLGEVARKLRKDQTKEKRRAYTTDDLVPGSPEVPDLPVAQSSEPDAWRQRLNEVRKKMEPFENMDSAGLARLALGNLEVDFPGRKEWQEQLFEQKKIILDLVRDAERAFQEYQEMRDSMMRAKGLTKGEEDKYEQARKRLEQAIDRSRAQGFKLDNIINEGKTRAVAWNRR